MVYTDPIPNQPRRSPFAVWGWPWWVWMCVVVFNFMAYYGSHRILLGTRTGVYFDQKVGSYMQGPIREYALPDFAPRELHEAIDVFFWPAYSLDRLMRPRFWSPKPKVLIFDWGDQ